MQREPDPTRSHQGGTTNRVEEPHPDDGTSPTTRTSPCSDGGIANPSTTRQAHSPISFTSLGSDRMGLHAAAEPRRVAELQLLPAPDSTSPSGSSPPASATTTAAVSVSVSLPPRIQPPTPLILRSPTGLHGATTTNLPSTFPHLAREREMGSPLRIGSNNSSTTTRSSATGTHPCPTTAQTMNPPRSMGRGGPETQSPPPPSSGVGQFSVATNSMAEEVGDGLTKVMGGAARRLRRLADNEGGPARAAESATTARWWQVAPKSRHTSGGGVGRNVDSHAYLNTRVIRDVRPSRSGSQPRHGDGSGAVMGSTPNTTSSGAAAAAATTASATTPALLMSANPSMENLNRLDGSVGHYLLGSPLAESRGGTSLRHSGDAAARSTSLRSIGGAGASSARVVPSIPVPQSELNRSDQSPLDSSLVSPLGDSRRGVGGAQTSTGMMPPRSPLTDDAGAGSTSTNASVNRQRVGLLKLSPTTDPRSISCIADAIRAARRPSLVSSEAFFSSRTNFSTGTSLFALFGMLERASRFEEFSRLYTAHRPVLAPFLAATSAHMLTEAGPEAAGAHRNLMHLLEHAEDNHRVGEDFYSDPINSWPIHMLYLTCCFMVTATSCGYEVLYDALRVSGGLMAVGKGLFAALAVAMSPTAESLPEATAKMYAAAFYVGILMRRQQRDLEWALRLARHRTFALLLVNIPIYTLRQLVQQVNRGQGQEGSLAAMAGVSASTTKAATEGTQRRLRPHSEIEVSRVISNRSAIVCGHPLDLMRLDIVLTGFANFNGVKIHKDYIAATAPENSGYYNRGVVFDLLGYWDAMGIDFTHDDLHLPVFSPVDGEVWSRTSIDSDGMLSHKVAEAATYRNHDLTYTLNYLRDGDVLLDFSTHALSIGPLIAWTKKRITIFSAPADRRERSVLPSPRRSAQDSAVLSTLHKLAFINVILREVMATMRRSWTGMVELFTTFEELGLLHDLRADLTGPGSPLRSPPPMHLPDLSQSADGGGGGGHSGRPHHDRSGVVPEPSVMDCAAGLSISSYPTNNPAGIPVVGSSTNLAGMSNMVQANELMMRSRAQRTTSNRYVSFNNMHRASGEPTLLQSPIMRAMAAAGLAGRSDGGGHSPVPTSGSHNNNNNNTSFNPTMAGDATESEAPGSPDMALWQGVALVEESAAAEASLASGVAHLPGTSSPPMPPSSSCGAKTNSQSGSPRSAVAPPQGGGFRQIESVSGMELSGGKRSVRGAHGASILQASSGHFSNPAAATPTNDTPYFGDEYVVQRNAKYSNVINVYQVSPLIKYYEMQSGLVMSDAAVLFARKLRERTGIEFPPYILLLCPTVFELLELWDGYEFMELMKTTAQ